MGRYRVLLFAQAREAAHTSDVTLDSAEPLAPQQLLERLASGTGVGDDFAPDATFAAVLPTCVIAINGEYAAADSEPIDFDSEVAVIPPISGG